jgi:hypothetical protein
MLYLLTFVVVAASVTIDGERVPKGSVISLRSDDPRAAAWEASPRFRLTGRELIGSVSSEATSAAAAHGIVDRLLSALADVAAAVGALDEAGRAAMGEVWGTRRVEVHDAADVFDALDDLLPGPADEPEAPAPVVSLDDPPFAPAPADDEGWDTPAAAASHHEVLAGLLADDDATLKLMHAAIEGLGIEVHPTKKAQREAIAAWLAANPG